jgi:trans-aconitate methyltransferase
MHRAHDALLNTIAGLTFERVVDLGCGDGTLLSRIPANRRVGIEIDGARAAKARGKVDRVEVADAPIRMW